MSSLLIKSPLAVLGQDCAGIVVRDGRIAEILKPGQQPLCNCG